MDWTRRRFITGVGAATLASTLPLRRTFAQTVPALPSLTTARSQADNVFSRLLTLWNDGLNQARYRSGWLWSDFWKAGNTLDAAITYFVLRNPSNTKSTAPSLIDKSLSYLFDRRRYGTGPWRDDYNWYGKAFANAYKNASLLGLSSSLKNRCRDAAITYGWTVCFNSATDSESFAPRNEAEKYIGTGFAAWNNGNVREYVNSPNPSTYTPVPNTVTNTGFWALSNSIYESVDINNQKYLDSMRKTFDWFWTFLQPGMLTNSVGLIVETPNPQVHPAWCRDPNRAWTGDQGKFLCGCLKTLKKEPAGSARAQNLSFLIDSLIQGFVNRTNTLVGADGVLREFDSDIVVTDDNNSNFNNNYCTGPGVFMRYLGECYSDLTAAQKTPFTALITTSAAAAWNNRASNYQIRAWYTNNLANTKYNKYYIKNSPSKTLWDFAFQAAALDLMVARLRLY